jgi:RNA polymerase sigma factor (sigma-70 family)
MLELKAMNDTSELMRAWVEQGSEEALAKLVARHIDLVYSVAVRKVAGDTGLAADVAQRVFTDLASKARSLRAEGSLAGWLHRHTCYVAAAALRSELRRRTREQTAAAMQALDQPPNADWSRLAPLLDDAVNALGEADRRAILLRFYEQHDLRAIGSELGVGEDAAQKRVARALEKLRGWLARRGVTSTAAALAALLGAHGVAAAPAGLAAKVAVTAASAAAAATSGAAALTVIEIMTHMKTKIAVAAAVAAVVATPVVWQENAIARARAENRALAVQAEPLDRLRAEQQRLAGLSSASDEAAQAARDRAELERLRRETASLRGQVQQADAALAASRAARAGGAGDQDPAAPKPGFISLQDAQDVGTATPEAMFQTYAWAIRTGDTNRLVALIDFSGEGAARAREAMLRKGIEKGDNGVANMGFRVIRQVPLDDGDVALVMEMDEGSAQANRFAARVRRDGDEWRLVMNMQEPGGVKLTEDQLRD